MRSILCFLLLCTVSSDALCSAFQPYFSINSFSHSEPTAIKALEDWDERFYSGDVALSHSHLEAGVGWDQWRIGLIQKYDYYYQFSASTAELLRTVNNREPLLPGDQFDLYLSVNTLESEGLRLSYLHSFSRANVSIGLSFIEASELTHGSIAGSADVLTDRDYDFLFDVDYFYSEDRLFERTVARPQGRGYGLDFMLDWHINDQWHLALDVYDLFSEVKWKSVPRTVATANSSTKEFDSDGYVIFKPVATGVELNQDFAQKLPTKILLKMQYKLQNKYPLLLEYDDYRLKQFVTAGYAFKVNDDAKFKALYNLTARSFKLAYHNQWLNFQLLTDKLSISKARTFGLQLHLSYPF